MMVCFGKPVAVMDYCEKYRQNQQSAIIALRDDLHQAILPLVLNFETKTNYDGFEAIRNICSKGKSSSYKNARYLPDLLETGRQAAQKLDKMEARNRQQAQSLANNALSFEKMLKSLNLRNWLVDKNEEKPGKLLLHIFYLLLTFPLFAFGFIFNGLPFILIDRMVKKKVKQAVFKSTFSFAVGLLLFPLAYIIEMLIVSFILPGWILKLVFIISLPFAGKFAFSWYILFLKTCGRWRWLKIKRSKPQLYNEIHRAKQGIIDEIASASFS